MPISWLCCCCCRCRCQCEARKLQRAWRVTESRCSSKITACCTLPVLVPLPPRPFRRLTWWATRRGCGTWRAWSAGTGSCYRSWRRRRRPGRRRTGRPTGRRTGGAGGRGKEVSISGRGAEAARECGLYRGVVASRGWLRERGTAELQVEADARMCGPVPLLHTWSGAPGGSCVPCKDTHGSG